MGDGGAGSRGGPGLGKGGCSRDIGRRRGAGDGRREKGVAVLGAAARTPLRERGQLLQRLRCRIHFLAGDVAAPGENRHGVVDGQRDVRGSAVARDADIAVGLGVGTKLDHDRAALREHVAELDRGGRHGARHQQQRSDLQRLERGNEGLDARGSLGERHGDPREDGVEDDEMDRLGGDQLAELLQRRGERKHRLGRAGRRRVRFRERLAREGEQLARPHCLANVDADGLQVEEEVIGGGLDHHADALAGLEDLGGELRGQKGLPAVAGAVHEGGGVEVDAAQGLVEGIEAQPGLVEGEVHGVRSAA